VNDPEVLGREAERSDALDHAARIGLVAYGVVHVLIGWLAVQLAFGDHSENASPSGALSTLAQQPFGKVLVWAVAGGLFLLAVWQLLEAAFGHRDADGVDRVRKRVVSAGRAVVYAGLGVIGVRAATGSGSSSSSGGSETLTAKLMDLPAGQWIVAAVGVAIVGYGASLVWRGWKEKFAEDLETEGKLGWSGAGYLLLGKVGYTAKGIALAIVGVLFTYAGATHEPGKSGGLDEALQTLLQQPFGPVLVCVVGVGIGCFGLFCFAEARHLDR
jgi:hypothetical protein